MEGKFVTVGSRKLLVRGTTYGTFRPGADGCEYPQPARVDEDFAAMSAAGLDAVRTYTVPPRWLLDAAHAHCLRVMVGLPWEQHVDFLADRGRARSIERRVREGVRACAGHPAVLCYAIGNEIPSSIVRWIGRGRVEGFLERLYRAAKAEDPAGLVTYVNYPSTEYLHLPFLDLVCFNVYLEREEELEAYLARLQNLARDRPLLMGEIGLDSRRNGEEVQALVLDWQVRTAFRAGCAGAFVFAWTDEWHRGGHDVDEWDFGLVDRHRRPKAALEAVSRAFAELPLAAPQLWPPMSVVVCAHDAAGTLRECLDGLGRVDYPDFEVIVVDDGSTDDTAAIAREYPVRLVQTPPVGLSTARNLGLAEAGGEVVAYLDADAWPDRHWLTYLASSFLSSRHVGVGGPNLPPPDGPVPTAVASTPGGPTHVLVSDTEAEHIPGCNMAFRVDALRAVGGFDPQFRVAGDDVDVCWRLQAAGGTLGFHAAAVVWHRRRDSVRGFLRQQRAYGRAEALLERKWPQKYNRGGHLTWRGRVYGGGHRMLDSRRWRVYYGTWGSGLFQLVYQPRPTLLSTLLLLPEWYLVVAVLGLGSLYGLVVEPLIVELPGVDVPLLLPLFALAGLAPLALALAGVRLPPDVGRSRPRRIALHLLAVMLHVLQPLARLHGRLGYGLTPWRTRGDVRVGLPRPRLEALWRERWSDPAATLLALEDALRPASTVLRRGGDFDTWDLHVQPGPLAGARLRLGVEEHGAGRQLLRFRIWPRLSRTGSLLVVALAAFAAGAGFAGARGGVVVAGGAAAFVLARMLGEAERAIELARAAVRALPEPGEPPLSPEALLADLEARLERAEGVEKARVADEARKR